MARFTVCEKCILFCIIGAGGVLGAGSRSAFSVWHANPALDTLVVNVLGSFLLGLLLFGIEYTGYTDKRRRMFFAVGFLGSFTTFSTFVLQSFQMPPAMACANILACVMLTLAGVFAGKRIAFHLSFRDRGEKGQKNAGEYGIILLFVATCILFLLQRTIPVNALLLAGAGGSVGAGLRYVVSEFCPIFRGIPTGTLMVNVSGSLLLALFTIIPLSTYAFIFVGTGLLGSFTTFSTFAYETFRLFENGQVRMALYNIVLNIGLCLVAVVLVYRVNFG